MEELLRHLIRETAFNLLLVGGEAERDRVERLAETLPSTRIKVMQNAPLAELAGWLAYCAGFAGHDSGISHLAAAVGLRSLILWGETTRHLAAAGRRADVVRDSSGLAELSVPVVINQLEQLLKRR